MEALRLDPEVFDRAELDRVAGELDHGAAVHLPARLSAVVAGLVAQLRAGRPVAVLAEEAELSSSEAAALLNVSRPHLVKLLDRGEMPFRMVGTHHRLLAADVLAYRNARSARRRQARSELINDLAGEDEY